MVMALILFLFVNYMVLSESMTMFVDAISILMVLGGAVPFALCGTGGCLSVSRLTNAAEGAVIAGWLGALYGGVMILSNIDERPLYEWMGSACAVMLLTVVYGYFTKALCRLVVLSRVSD
jgi:flagellar motor component MotA